MMIRDFIFFNRYLNELMEDVYPQPPDEGHTRWALEVIDSWMPQLDPRDTVLDVGCGQGFCKPLFERWNSQWTGITLGEDYQRARDAGLNVFQMDMSFLKFPDNCFNVVFARHTLEHSPMPLLTLMEWHRVCKNWLILVMPVPDYWGWTGRNHYSVMTNKVIEFYLERAGWKVLWRNHTDKEYRFMAEKDHRMNWRGE